MALHMKDGVEFEVPDEPPAAPEIPSSVTPRQLQLALLAAGRLDDVENFVANLPPQYRAAQIEWNKASVYNRNNATLNQMAPMLDPPMLPAEIDEIFIAARQIPDEGA